MSKRTILLIEDDQHVRENTAEILELANYTVITAENGRRGVEQARNHKPDLVLCDIMMPELDGYGVLHLLGRDPATAEVPFIFLSAKAERSDVRKGMELGADDYLTKPFEFDELLARARALLRRGKAAESSVLRYRDVELDLTRRTVKRGEETIALTAKEFALLEYFMRNAGRVLTRTSIGEHVWDMNFEPTSNVIDVYVSMLRRKIDKGFDTPLIHTVIGTGYIFSDQKPG
jgi:DNA-binding response OmpR family regulator